jgi:hypothetical protein
LPRPHRPADALHSAAAGQSVAVNSLMRHPHKSVDRLLVLRREFVGGHKRGYLWEGCTRIVR